MNALISQIIKARVTKFCDNTRIYCSVIECVKFLDTPTSAPFKLMKIDLQALF